MGTSGNEPPHPVATTTRRPRSARGQGRRLREEIIAASADLLDESGTDQDVTLRAVARRVGIAAPSIYAHFPDREAMLGAVVQEAFLALEAHLRTAQAAAVGPVARLRALCSAYLDFSQRWPQRYRVMFGGLWSPTVVQDAADRPPDPAGIREPLIVGDGAFTLTVQAIADCVATGNARGTDPFVDATALWVALHGLAHLQSAPNLFPWPAHLLDELVNRIALLDTEVSDGRATCGW